MPGRSSPGPSPGPRAFYGDFTASSLGQIRDQSLGLLAALTEQLRSENEQSVQRHGDAAEFNLAGIPLSGDAERAADQVEVIDSEATVLDAGDDECSADDVAAETEERTTAQEPAGPADVAAFADLPLFAYVGTSNGHGDSGDAGDAAAVGSQPPAIPEATGEPVQLSLFVAA